MPLKAYRDAEIWTTCTPLICFAIVEWHQSDRVQLQFDMFQQVPAPPNNLEKLHKIDMRGRHDENWQTKHARWINMWNNHRELTLTGRPIHRPLFHSKEYMEWYMVNSIYFLLVSHLLNDPRTQQNQPPGHTFPPTSNYNHSQEDPCRHSFATATDYYSPQQQPHRHSFASEQFNTPQRQPMMDVEYNHLRSVQLISSITCLGQI